MFMWNVEMCRHGHGHGHVHGGKGRGCGRVTPASSRPRIARRRIHHRSRLKRRLAMPRAVGIDRRIRVKAVVWVVLAAERTRERVDGRVHKRFERKDADTIAR